MRLLCEIFQNFQILQPYAWVFPLFFDIFWCPVYGKTRRGATYGA